MQTDFIVVVPFLTMYGLGTQPARMNDPGWMDGWTGYLE
jgi:hypothetical protein